jgi:hypothetical protein
VTTVIYAAHPLQNLPAPAPAGRLLMSWTGWDGSQWDLSRPEASGVFVSAGVRGLGMPDATLFSSESPAVDGSRFRGYRFTAREVFWPVHIVHDPGMGWVDRDGAFWRTMRPDAPGVWSVTDPNGNVRSLTCRWVSGGGDALQLDPTSVGWATYGVYLVADEDPFWTGAPIIREFSAGAQVPFFDAADSPPFHISPSNLLAEATMNNPGDVDAFPIWRVDGPVTTVTVGVMGRTIVAPLTVVEGESLTIDTRPTAQTAIRSTGVDVTGSLGAVDFAAIPPGASVPLTLSMTGTGKVTASLTPRFLKAW